MEWRVDTIDASDYFTLHDYFLSCMLNGITVSVAGVFYGRYQQSKTNLYPLEDKAQFFSYLGANNPL